MAEQVRKAKSQQRDKVVVEETAKEKTAETKKTDQELKDELDDLLNSIDEALGENVVNAEAFVAAYINRGGQ